MASKTVLCQAVLPASRGHDKPTSFDMRLRLFSSVFTFLVSCDKKTALSYLAIGVKKRPPEQRRSLILNILGCSDEKKRQRFE